MDVEKTVARIETLEQEAAAIRQDMNELYERHEDDRLFRHFGPFYPEHMRIVGRAAILVTKATIEYARTVPLFFEDRRNRE